MVKVKIFVLIIFVVITAQSQELYIEQSIGSLKISEYSDYNFKPSYKTIVGVNIRNILRIYARLGYWRLKETNSTDINNPYSLKVNFISPGFGIKFCILSDNHKTGVYLGANGVYYFVSEKINHATKNILIDYAGKTFGYSYELGIFHKIYPRLETSLGVELLSQIVPLQKGTVNGDSIMDSNDDYRNHPVSFAMDGLNINFSISYSIF